MPPIPIKDAAGIAGMRASCRLARKILEELCTYLEPGKTTGEIDRKAGELIAQHGARSAFLGYRKFPGQLCISVNEEVVHGIGGLRRLGYGDVVKLDVGIILDGWVGDTATTVGAWGYSTGAAASAGTDPSGLGSRNFGGKGRGQVGRCQPCRGDDREKSRL